MAQKTGAPIRQSLAKQMRMCDWPPLSASWVSLTPFLCLFPGPRDALMLPSSGFSSLTQVIQRMGWILRYPLELLSGDIGILQKRGFVCSQHQGQCLLCLKCSTNMFQIHHVRDMKTQCHCLLSSFSTFLYYCIGSVQTHWMCL